MTVDGFPEPTVEWKRDNKPLKHSNKCNISKEGQVARMQINSMTEADDGVFSITAINCVGETSSSCKAAVEGK